MAVLFGHVSAAPEPVRKHRAAIPAQLGDMVMKCLEKDRAARWQTADEVLQQLEALATPSEGTKAGSAKATVAATVPSRAFTRGRRILAASFVVLAVVTGFAVNRFSGRNATGIRMAEASTDHLGTAARKAADFDQPTGTKPIIRLTGKEPEQSHAESATRKAVQVDQRMGSNAQALPVSHEPNLSQPNSAANNAEDAASLSSLLSEFAQAIEARDMSNMIAVFPSMSGSQKSGWTDFFTAMKTFRAALTMHGLVVSGDSAHASVAGAYYFVDTDGKTNRRVIKYNVRFGKDSGAWIILSMD
jgi:hypothetical protein